MITQPVTRFFRDTHISRFLPLPVEVLSMELPSTAVLLYARLLYRGTSSQKNGYTDEAGWVYVVYPTETIARDMGLQRKIIQKHLKALEEAGLILRRRPVGNRASHIYLNIPAASVSSPSPVPSVPPGGKNSTHPIPANVPTSKNIKKENKKIFYDLYDEEESL